MLGRNSRSLLQSFLIKCRLFPDGTSSCMGCLNFSLEICCSEIYFCVHGETCCYSNFFAHTFFPSCFHKHFKTHMYHHISSFKIIQPAACFTLVLQLLRGRIPVYTSHCPLLLDIVFKEHFRLLTSTGQSFQSDISIYNKASYPMFVKSISKQVENEVSCLLPLGTGRDVSSRDLDQRCISR